MPLVQTRGAASAQGFGEFAQASGPANYIEDMFSCFLYTGNGVGYPSGPTITNGIDLAGKGGMVWGKARSSAFSNWIYDTARGVGDALTTNGTDAEYAGGATAGVNSFNSNGFGFGDNVYNENSNGVTYVSWTFRKQPKFFDVVTYTGTGANRTIAHSLGSVPGSIIVKRTDSAAAWAVYHRSLANTEYLVLNTTAAKATGATWWNSTTPTSAVFSLGTDASVNASGGTYVAYIYAHDAGGFGLSGTDNVISCGSYTGNGSANGPVVTLGYEPQWLIVKAASISGNWFVFDNMRGMTVGGSDANLKPNSNVAEANESYVDPTATGFNLTSASSAVNSSAETYIYIAIRRGPMKVPTLGTSVYTAITYNGVNTAGQVISGAGFSPDLALTKARNGGGGFHFTWMDRLRGTARWLFSDDNVYEGSVAGYGVRSFDMDGVTFGTAYGDYTNLAYTYVAQFLRRAPSFFDEVCYRGTGVAGQAFNHNLTAVPELMIIKNRTDSVDWGVYSATTGNTKALFLNHDLPQTSNDVYWWNNTSPTSTQFSLGQYQDVNGNTKEYVAYLFATCAGVSKVGSYTGNAGYTVTVPCGFTAGVRFVLIKRTDSTGNWWVYDSARGITSGNDPYLYLNSTAAEVGGTDYIDSYSAGFEVTSTAPAGLNATGGTYIFLAIA